MPDIKELLKTLADSGGSDLHLKVGAPPIVRIDGELRRLDSTPMTQDDTELIAKFVMPRDRRERLEGQNEADFGYSLAGVGRFRVNVFRQRSSLSMVFRRIRIGSASFEELGLPTVVRDLAEQHRGLVLVTGPTGTGKTTTLAAMIDHINRTRALHILTIEDPIEVLHRDYVASVNQREVGIDTDNYVAAMRAAMREDPDVILIGEMRDTETVTAAMAAAETGHLVLSTLHTSNAVETVNRIIDFYPENAQHQVRVSLAASLKGVICQRLVRRADGGRVPTLEILINNGRVAERVLDPTTTSEIHEIIERGEAWGMQTFDRHLLQLVKAGTVSVEDAFTAATNAHDFELALQQAGLVVPA
jgi:twitching motility protein PilT